MALPWRKKGEFEEALDQARKEIEEMVAEGEAKKAAQMNSAPTPNNPLHQAMLQQQTLHQGTTYQTVGSLQQGTYPTYGGGGGGIAGQWQTGAVNIPVQYDGVRKLGPFTRDQQLQLSSVLDGEWRGEVNKSGEDEFYLTRKTATIGGGNKAATTQEIYDVAYQEGLKAGRKEK